jgi:hypothetical protein
MKAIFQQKLPSLARAEDRIKQAAIPGLKGPVMVGLDLEEQMEKIKAQCPLLLTQKPTLELEGDRKTNAAVQLKWETTNGWNNRDFLLERSFNDTFHFEAVGYTLAREIAGMRDEYEQPDQNSHPKLSYYRLKLTLRNGEFIYSNIAKVKGYETGMVGLFPNPSVNKLQLTVVADQQGVMTVIIYDARGKQLKQLNNLAVIAGLNNKEIAVADLPAGFYTIKMMMPDKTERAVKFIKM